MKLFVAALCVALFSSTAQAEERNLPEELRALAVLCSSGASVEFRGKIEGGINRFFGKVLSGEGDLAVSKSEDAFLKSFDDEGLRLEARKIYNDCVLGTIGIVYNIKDGKTKRTPTSKLLVPNSLVQIQPGEKFALRDKDSIGISGNGVITISSIQESWGDDKCNYPYTAISHKGKRDETTMKIGMNLKVPNNERCYITYYGSRLMSENNKCVYSYIYQCN